MSFKIKGIKFTLRFEILKLLLLLLLFTTKKLIVYFMWLVIEERRSILRVTECDLI